jgi:chemotaxis protein MotA
MQTPVETLMTLTVRLGVALFGVTLVAWGASAAPGPAQALINPSGLGIVVGGTLAAALLTYPTRELGQLVHSLWVIVSGRNHPDPDQLINECVTLAGQLRDADSGEEAKRILENERGRLSHPFLQDGANLIANGYTDAMLRETLETSIAARMRRESDQVRTLRTLGNYAPAFGMIGALIGFAAMASAPAEAATGVTGALASAIYGLLLAHWVFYPLAEMVETRRQHNLRDLELMLTAVLLLQARHHAIYVEGVLNAFLAPVQRYSRLNQRQRSTTAAPTNPAPRSSFRQTLNQATDEPPAERPRKNKTAALPPEEPGPSHLPVPVEDPPKNKGIRVLRKLSNDGDPS